MALAVGSSDISNELWQSALEALERKFSKPIFEMWIKPIRLVSITGDELVLSVQSNFARDWVEHRLKTQIAEVLSEVFGATLELQFTVAEPGQRAGRRAAGRDRPCSARPKTCAAPTSMRAIRSKSSSSATPTASPTRQPKRSPCAPARAYNPLFLYGGVGLGQDAS